MSDTLPNKAIPVEIPHAQPLSKVEIGEYVSILFWHAYPMPGNNKHGWWDTLIGRVISYGKMIVCEVSPTTPVNFGEDQPVQWDRSPLRFVNPDRVFDSEQTAKRYAIEQKLEPPLEY